MLPVSLTIRDMSEHCTPPLPLSQHILQDSEQVGFPGNTTLSFLPLFWGFPSPLCEDLLGFWSVVPFFFKDCGGSVRINKLVFLVLLLAFSH